MNQNNGVVEGLEDGFTEFRHQRGDKNYLIYAFETWTFTGDDYADVNDVKNWSHYRAELREDTSRLTGYNTDGYGERSNEEFGAYGHEVGTTTVNMMKVPFKEYKYFDETAQTGAVGQAVGNVVGRATATRTSAGR